MILEKKEQAVHERASGDEHSKGFSLKISWKRMRVPPKIARKSEQFLFALSLVVEYRIGIQMGGLGWAGEKMRLDEIKWCSLSLDRIQNYPTEDKG